MPLKVVFMGTPDFAVPTLAEIVGGGHEVVAVYTRAPAPAGRGMALRPSPVQALAEKFGLPVLTPTTLRTEEAAETFRAHGADVAVVVAYGMILPPAILDAPALGLAINLGAGGINAAWAWALMRWGRAWRSPALIADARHIVADVVTSCGVLVGVAAVWLTGYPILDPAVAGLVALNILWSGFRMVRESVDGLMDRAAPADMVCEIRSLISRHGEGALEAHDVRTRSAGQATFIDFHLVVPGTMTVEASHAICDRLENALETTIPGAVVTIHVEPGEEAKARGLPVL